MHLRHSLTFSLGLLCSVFGASAAHADIPAGYAGTPYMGTAQAIPGRVELANLDLGGINVAWYADHNRMNSAGYQPISGNDYRTDDQDLPNICKTNKKVEDPNCGGSNNCSEDFWEDGTRYPTGALHGATAADLPTWDPAMGVYYMGFAHTVDWVRVTVNVAQAGTYNVSSNWACANNPCGLSIWFNDGSGAMDNPDKPLDGANKTGTVMLDATNDYHKWRAYPNFTQVTLSAGLQVMTFNLEIADHLQYGFLQFDLVGAGGAGAGGAGAGGAAAGGASAGGAGGVSAGGAAAGGVSTGGTVSAGGTAMGGTTAAAGGSAGSMGNVGGPTGNAGTAGSSTTTTGAGGSSATATGGSAMMSTTNGAMSPDVNSKSGCAFAPLQSERSSHTAEFSALMLLGAVLLRRRR